MPSTRSFSRTILIATLVAGTLDIADAFIFSGIHGVSAKRVLLYIASAVLGRPAFSGGIPTQVLGLLLHYLVTLVWTSLFVLLAQRSAFMRRYAVVFGLFYGMFIYACMNGFVLGLTRAPHISNPSFAALLNGVLALMLLVGLPVALFSRRVTPAG